jgi:hypothetical protein
MKTFMLFVDLAKDFDTIHHTVLFGIPRKYGIPEQLINVIARMYKDCKVQVKIGKKVRAIDCNTGIQQGDNMAPIIFIFCCACSVNGTQSQIDTELIYVWALPIIPSSHWRKSRRLINQNYRAKGALLELFHVLFVDDSMFLFETLEELTR